MKLVPFGLLDENQEISVPSTRVYAMKLVGIIVFAVLFDDISVPSTRVYAMKPTNAGILAVPPIYFSTLDSGLRDET